MINPSFQLFKKFLILLATFISGCSVYKSGGRNNFENAASNAQVKVSSQQAPTNSINSYSTCWEQPAKDALWESYNHMWIDKIDEETIRVCIKNEIQ